MRRPCGAELLEPARRGRVRAACALALLLSACGDSQSPAPIEPQSDAERSAAGWENMNGYPVPPRSFSDPMLPDSCTLLTEADPRGMIQKPLGPIMRVSDVCIAYDSDTPTLAHSLQVELRRPVPVELERGGLPSSRDQYWEAEGVSVEMLGGSREGIQDFPGVGDYAVWYPIGDGFSLHTYWQGRYVLRLTMRGIEKDAALTWARQVARRAIDVTAASADPGATSR